MRNGKAGKEWYTQKGDIVKIYVSPTKSETGGYAIWLVGKVIDNEFRKCKVQLMKDNPIRFDRYLEIDDVRFANRDSLLKRINSIDHKYLYDVSPYIKYKKVLALKKD